MRILIICTGNTCRSQMAEGFIRSYFPEWEVFSAGTRAEQQINPLAVEVMREIGLDIRQQFPKSVEKFLDMDFDYLITVCDGAQQQCPVFHGKQTQKLHIGFEEPALAKGNISEQLAVYRSVRDQIHKTLLQIFKPISKSNEH